MTMTLEFAWSVENYLEFQRTVLRAKPVQRWIQIFMQILGFLLIVFSSVGVLLSKDHRIAEVIPSLFIGVVFVLYPWVIIPLLHRIRFNKQPLLHNKMIVEVSDEGYR